MTLTKADLVGQLVGQSGLDRPDAKQLVNQMFEEIRGSLENGEAANERAQANQQTIAGAIDRPTR